MTATPASFRDQGLTNAPLPGLASEALFEQAKMVFPDGATPATIERNPVPLYAVRGEGAYLIDADGLRFLDLNGNFATLIHGHAFERVSRPSAAGPLDRSRPDAAIIAQANAPVVLAGGGVLSAGAPEARSPDCSRSMTARRMSPSRHSPPWTTRDG